MVDDDEPALEDERQIELSSISAIFPEIVLDLQDPFSASIDLPVVPAIPLPVVFPESSDDANGSEPKPETHSLSYLPCLRLRMALPEGYPSISPPTFHLSISPQWLSDTVLEKLQSDGQRLWEELGRDQVVFAYIDHLQQAAENAFGVLGENEFLQVSQDHKISLLDFDIKAKRAAFEKETFDCGVCLDPKKGSSCHRMLACGHVFCRQCLQDFYNNAITDGDLASVRCLAPDCAKKRGVAGESPNGKRRKPKTRISPSELLQIPLEYDMVKRYVALKHKAELESDKNTIYCPRNWCQGAARSQKHRKPAQSLDAIESSDEESDNEKTTGPSSDCTELGELLAVCEDCSFAFCSRCYQGWHGQFTLCTRRTNTGELTEEDKASLEYLKLHTTPCPTCAAPAQKTHGCNHMICFRCNTHFCYLCSAWLEPGNPYQHYNLKTTSCYMRLWELEGGDGDDVGIGFAGGVQARNGVVQIQDDQNQNWFQGAFHLPEDDDDIDDEEEEEEEEEPAPNPVAPRPIAREGPLVLRIGLLPPQVAAAPQQAAVVNVQQGPQARRPPQQPIRRAVGNYEPRPAGRRHAAAAAAAAAGRAAAQQAPRPRAGRQAGVPAANRNAPAARAPANANGPGAAMQEAAHHAWVQHFVQMALNDQEDQVEWDSDDEENAGEWQIPVR